MMDKMSITQLPKSTADKIERRNGITIETWYKSTITVTKTGENDTKMSKYTGLIL